MPLLEPEGPATSNIPIRVRSRKIPTLPHPHGYVAWEFKVTCVQMGGLHGEIWVNAHAPEPAEEVAESAHCQRPGCKEQWPAPVYK